MKNKKPFYPFGFAFEVKSLHRPVYNQLIGNMKFRQFFDRRWVLALNRIKKYEAQGAFKELGTYRIVVESLHTDHLLKEPAKEADG